MGSADFRRVTLLARLLRFLSNPFGARKTGLVDSEARALRLLATVEDWTQCGTRNWSTEVFHEHRQPSLLGAWWGGAHSHNPALDRACRMLTSRRLAFLYWSSGDSTTESNRRRRTRTYGGVGGVDPQGSPPHPDRRRVRHVGSPSPSESCRLMGTPCGHGSVVSICYRAPTARERFLPPATRSKRRTRGRTSRILGSRGRDSQA